MCNNGLHTIHHNRATLHWSELWDAHQREAAPRIDPSLNERSMVWFLLRTYVLTFARPKMRAVAEAEKAVDKLELPSRTERRDQIEAAGTAV
jgi:hypothetical protein